jgi:hypothetical protein
MGAVRKIQAPKSLADLSPDELAQVVCDAVDRRVEAILARLAAAQPEGRLMAPAEAAHFLGISTGALRHHVARKHIVPDVRAGKDGLRAHQFSRATLEAFRRRSHGRQKEK